jgi:hypothetical protein
MTIKSFLFISFLQGVLAVLLKVLFFHWLDLGNLQVQVFIFWIAVIVVSTALVRRLGILNYLEAGFISFCWTFGNILVDFLITKPFVPEKMFSTWQYWIGALLLIMSVFFFHKKRHVELRKAQHGHH